MNLKDGGSVRYKALVYEVTKIHQLAPEVDGVKPYIEWNSKSKYSEWQFIEKQTNRQIPVDISHILGNLITVIFDYQILRKPLKILSL